MNKRIIILLLLLPIFLLGACSDETDYPTIPEPDTDSAVLSILLGSPQTKAFDTPDEEKDVQSVACFVKTNDTGEVGSPAYKQGSFLKYFIDTMTDNGDGTYTVSLKIKTTSLAGETQVIIIANYKENGLYDILNSVNSLEELVAVHTQSVTATGIATPLLMYAEEKVALQFNISVTKTFNLKRIMARIDIYNEIAATAKNPFELQSATIVNPKEYSYLIPGNDDAFNIPVRQEGFTARIPGSDPAKIEGLYTYETANDGSSDHTAVLVKGTLGGNPYSKIIKLLKGDDPVPLGRNTRYQISLNSSPDPTEISFSFKIEDWSDGAVIPAPPSNEKPNPVNFSFGGGFTQARWNAPEKLYNMEGQQSGTISFSVTGQQEVVADVVPVFHVPGSEFDVSDIVKGGDVIYNPDATITQNFSIEVSVAGKLQNKEPLDIYVHLKNAVKLSYRDTICITTLLNYPGTQFKPVWLGGLYWAPVNVGATQLEPDIENGLPVRTNAQMGYYFQWGRNAPHYLMPSIPLEKVIQGPVSFVEANKPANIDKHINTDGGIDWLLANDGNMNIRNALWSNGNDNDNPCPAGWRLPTYQEVTPIDERFDYDNMIDISKKRFTYIGDDGQLLYFPFVSHTIYHVPGSIQTEQLRILFWTSTVFEPYNGTAHVMDTMRKEWIAHAIAYGFTVRCVRK